jgi:hypothetical protein
MSDRNEAVPHDTEDKGWWLRHGEKLEVQFVELCKVKLGLDAHINPDKKNDPMVPDLIVGGVLADLKTQNTPFFTASRYGVDPRFAVTFNRKDYERYKKLYPSIVLYFWLNWTQTEWKGTRVDYYGGIFRLSFPELALVIERGAPEHTYQRREGDTAGNAKSSFVLDVHIFEPLFVAEKRGAAF